MTGKSRPTSGSQRAPATPVPLKADPPPAPKSPAPTPKRAQEQPTASEQLRVQVDDLLDKAEENVRTLNELAAEPADAEESNVDPTPDQPRPSAEEPVPSFGDDLDGPTPVPATPTDSSEPVDQVESRGGASQEDAETEKFEADDVTAEEFIEESSLDDPVDPAVLQSQVDAILAESGHVVESLPDATEANAGESLKVESEAPADGLTEPIEEEAGAAESMQGAPAESSAGADRAADSASSSPDEQEEKIDIAAVDAVIADAAQRAMEQDDLDGSDPTVERSQPDDEQPAAGQAAQSQVAPPGAVRKGGNVSMRDNPPPRPPAAAPKPADAERAPEKAEPARDTPSGRSTQPAAATLDPSLKARLLRLTLQGLARLNAPWHSWPPVTRYALLGLTAANLVFAAAAYVLLIKRWL